jgi:hypothetical protein
MTAQAFPAYFGRIKTRPSDPKPSQFGGSDRLVTVEVDEYGEHKLWYEAGKILDYLQPGDMVLLDFKSNKFKISKQQTPELLQQLQRRASQAPAQPVAVAAGQLTPFDDEPPAQAQANGHQLAAPAPAQTNGDALSLSFAEHDRRSKGHRPPATTDAVRFTVSEAVREAQTQAERMAQIYLTLRQCLPNVDDRIICDLACRVYAQQ